MASAKNKVIAGDYLNCPIFCMFNDLSISVGFKSINLDKNNIKHYEVIDEEKRKSASSTIIKAGLGSVLLGPIGLLAGVAGKQKGIYTIAIKFKDEKESLIEVNEKIYKQLIKKMF
jgi:conserved hypothetical protein